MSRVNIAIISPTKYLNMFSACGGNNYHMVLAHRYLNDPLYKNFYDIERTKDNSIIVLDNGACELKSSITNENLYKVATSIKPNIIVLPDVLGNVDMTIQRSLSFINDYRILKKRFGVKFMAVPQGTNLKSWLKAFNTFYKLNDVDLLGLSDVSSLNIHGKLRFDRNDAIEYLLSVGYRFENKPIHILGLGDSGHLEISRLRKYNFIEGIDTSAPIVHGYYNIVFQKGKAYTKIKKYLPNDLCDIEQSQINNIIKNIETLYAMSS